MCARRQLCARLGNRHALFGARQQQWHANDVLTSGLHTSATGRAVAAATLDGARFQTKPQCDAAQAHDVA